MSKEQTALTIFFDKIRVRFDKDSEEYEQLVTDYVLAKGDERQQIIEAHGIKQRHGYKQGVSFWEATTGEQYYNNKYGK